MSLVALLGSWGLPLLLVGLIFWDGWFLTLALMIIGLVVIVILSDLFVSNFHYYWAFLLFIIREICLFISFLHSRSWFYRGDWIRVRDSLEIPFVGCFLLLGSSVSITGFHHVLGWEHSWVLLLLTTLLGRLFVWLQLIEFSETDINFFSKGFYRACLRTISLHFVHVLVGVISMLGIVVVGVYRVGYYMCSVVTWYWHFVDYVWLLVYALVYMCFMRRLILNL